MRTNAIRKSWLVNIRDGSKFLLVGAFETREHNSPTYSAVRSRSSSVICLFIPEKALLRRFVRYMPD